MIPCQINLYILVHNKTNWKYEIVSLSDNNIVIPSIDINSNDSIIDLLKKLFEQCVDFDSFFANFILSDVTNKDKLIIHYYCLMHYSIVTKLKKVYLHSINTTNEIFIPAINKILSKI